MKTLNKYIFIPVLLLAWACNDDHETTYGYQEFVQFSTTGTSVDENAGSIAVTVQLVGPQRNVPTDITFSVSETNLVEGVDYELSDGNTVTIPANESSVTFTIDLLDNDDYTTVAKSLGLFITEADGVSLQSENATKRSYNLTVNEDDCPAPSLVGTYSVVNRDASPAACGDPANDGVFTYQATITLVSENEDGTFTYQVSDVTGGLYSLCYGDAENPGQIVTDQRNISLTSQPDVVYGNDEFNGSGVMDCDGNFTLTWANGYGDKATSHYTKL